MKNNKGFTLMEILAVIVILGIIMVIAIPAISQNILDSRKSSYVTSVRKFIDAAREEVSTFNYKANNVNTAYYIPTKCLQTENGDSSPFGDFLESYVVVVYNSNGIYDYYYTGRDETNHGFELTKSDEISTSNLKDNITSINTSQKVAGRDLIVVYSDSCDKTSTKIGAETSIICGRTEGEPTGWSTENRTITIECQGNCLQSSFTKTFTETTVNGYDEIIIKDKNGVEKSCKVNVYIDKSTPDVNLTPQDTSTGLNFTLNSSGTVGPSGKMLKFCVDGYNLCFPNIEVEDGKQTTMIVTKTYDSSSGLYNMTFKFADNTEVTATSKDGKYYVRYQLTTGAGYTTAIKNYSH